MVLDIILMRSIWVLQSYRVQSVIFIWCQVMIWVCLKMETLRPIHGHFNGTIWHNDVLIHCFIVFFKYGTIFGGDEHP